MIRVLIADDHGVLRDGLRRLLDEQEGIEVVAAAGNGRQAVAEAIRCTPDAALLDIAMPEQNGLDAAREIIDRSPSTSVLMLSVEASGDTVRRSFAAGARGYLLKDSGVEEVVAAIRAVVAGQRYVGEGVAQAMLDEGASGPAATRERSVTSLNARERSVLTLIAEGRTSAEAAAALKLSPRTVEAYRARIMDKLGIDNLAALVKYAVRNGLTSGR